MGQGQDQIAIGHNQKSLRTYLVIKTKVEIESCDTCLVGKWQLKPYKSVHLLDHLEQLLEFQVKVRSQMCIKIRY